MSIWFGSIQEHVGVSGRMWDAGQLVGGSLPESLVWLDFSDTGAVPDAVAGL